MVVLPRCSVLASRWSALHAGDVSRTRPHFRLNGTSRSIYARRQSRFFQTWPPPIFLCSLRPLCAHGHLTSCRFLARLTSPFPVIGGLSFKLQDVQFVAFALTRRSSRITSSRDLAQEYSGHRRALGDAILKRTKLLRFAQ